jgi:DNA-binding XRE family transcriptional regulator
MSNTVAELEHQLEEAEDRYDALLLRLADIELAVNGGENLPLASVRRLSEGVSPVRVWREHRGLSSRELATQAGVSPALLSEIESGKKEGSIRTLAGIARVLGIEVDELLPWDLDRDRAAR